MYALVTTLPAVKIPYTKEGVELLRILIGSRAKCTCGQTVNEGNAAERSRAFCDAVK